MSVSVCLPTYNGAAFLEETLQSILSQEYQDLELIIVDDVSTDATLDIVGGFSDPRIQVHRNPERLGIPGNWNHALSLAQGEFVCIFHQDDVMQPGNMLRKVEMLNADSTIGFVHSAVDAIVDESAPSSFADWIEDEPQDVVLNGIGYFRRLLLRGNRICAPTVVARREHLLGHGGFDEDLGFACDHALWLKMCVSHNVGFLSQPLVRYRWHGDNASHAYQFEAGADEVGEAGRRALRLYQEDARHVDGPVLEEALSALDALRNWSAELRRANACLEEQRSSLLDVVDARNAQIDELMEWIAEIEEGKAWLEEQRASWEQVARQSEGHVQAKGAYIHDIEVDIRVLEERNTRLRTKLDTLGASRFGRLGVFLRAIDPEVFADPPS